MQPAKFVLGQSSHGWARIPSFHSSNTKGHAITRRRNDEKEMYIRDGTCGFHIGLPLYLSPQVNILETQNIRKICDLNCMSSKKCCFWYYRDFFLTFCPITKVLPPPKKVFLILSCCWRVPQYHVGKTLSAGQEVRRNLSNKAQIAVKTWHPFQLFLTRSLTFPYSLAKPCQMPSPFLKRLPQGKSRDTLTGHREVIMDIFQVKGS